MIVACFYCDCGASIVVCSVKAEEKDVRGSYRSENMRYINAMNCAGKRKKMNVCVCMEWKSGMRMKKRKKKKKGRKTAEYVLYRRFAWNVSMAHSMGKNPFHPSQWDMKNEIKKQGIGLRAIKEKREPKSHRKNVHGISKSLGSFGYDHTAKHSHPLI